MIRLLVSADDFGSGPGRNRGIIEAFLHGIVTGASLLANGPAFADAVALARAHALPVGVHLNLSEGRAVSGPIAGITDPDGRFPGKGELRQRLLADTFDATAAARELRAQIAHIRAAGLDPDHLDTHQHCLLFPALTAIVADVAESSGIKPLRLPLPLEPAAADPDGPLGAELALYRALAPACAATLHAAGCVPPDGLCGMPLLDRLEEEHLLRTLTDLPAGTWELMTHPGHVDRGHPFSGPERVTELAALTAPAVHAEIVRRGIALVSFCELPCAS